MGKIKTTGAELAERVATDTLAAVAAGTHYLTPQPNRKFNAFVTGTFVATVKVQVSFDGGATWLDTGTQFTTPGFVQMDAAEQGLLYRFNCTAFTSGSASCRFSQ